jgi:hypothetical protein
MCWSTESDKDGLLWQCVRRSCLVERVAAGETFDVPRTALLLTGSVKSLLPLPAQFHAAVQNPHRTSSAADILWPSNISSLWGSASESANSRPSGPGHSSSENDSTHSRQHFVLPSSAVQSPAAAQQDGTARDQSRNGSNGAAAAQPGSIRVVVDDGSAAGAPKGSPAAAAGGDAGSSGAGADAGDLLLLAAPAELPPGEFKGIEEAMVLQVRQLQCNLPHSLVCQP